jgi:hypothetical protein
MEWDDILIAWRMCHNYMHHMTWDHYYDHNMVEVLGKPIFVHNPSCFLFVQL